MVRDGTVFYNSYDVLDSSIVWHGMAWYGMVWYGMVWYGIA